MQVVQAGSTAKNVVAADCLVRLSQTQIAMARAGTEGNARESSLQYPNCPPAAATKQLSVWAWPGSAPKS